MDVYIVHTFGGRKTASEYAFCMNKVRPIDDLWRLQYSYLGSMSSIMFLSEAGFSQNGIKCINCKYLLFR